jgi:hypothetical protein
MKKADEMELAINCKAARSAYAFLETAIMVYCLIEAMITGEIPTILFLFACVGGMVFWAVKFFETRRMTKTEREDEE